MITSAPVNHASQTTSTDFRNKIMTKAEMRAHDDCSDPRQRLLKESAIPVDALAVLSLAIDAASVSCCSAGFSCTTAACCGSLFAA
ncbi:MAG: hypothetical protein ACLQKH_00010 [Steroidobacteraceae bacterium]